MARMKRRGKTRHPNRAKSTFHTVCGGGKPAQDVVDMSDMDGERNLSAQGGQQLAHMHPCRGGCQKSRCVAADNTKLRDRKGNEADVGMTAEPLRLRLELGGLLSTA
jgi:hypothetical protein